MGADTAGPDATPVIETRPGYWYELMLPSADGIPIGTRWEGVILVRRGDRTLPTPAPDAGPLAPMYRKRIVLKLNDLASEFFPAWKRFCTVVEENGGRADLGINAGACDDEVFDWVRSFDLSALKSGITPGTTDALVPITRATPMMCNTKPWIAISGSWPTGWVWAGPGFVDTSIARM